MGETDRGGGWVGARTESKGWGKRTELGGGCGGGHGQRVRAGHGQSKGGGGGMEART